MNATVNQYYRQLTADEIAAGQHRESVGGLWDEIGKLQLDFLVSFGLRPEHQFIDVGCGALRGGVHFVRYLEPGHYHGLDLNASLIDAGRLELETVGLNDRGAKLLVDDQFAVSRFGTTFDFGLAQSVFTHMPLNMIVRCLFRVREALARNGRFLATFFQAPRSAHLEMLIHQPSGARTYYDEDPYHYSIEEMRFAARLAGLSVDLVGDWGHPRDQQMLAFSKRASLWNASFSRLPRRG